MEIEGVPERIARRIELATSGCWLWTGKPIEGGYGQCHFQFPGESQRNWLVHRLIPRLMGLDLGEHMHHRCETPACCNPAHLQPTDAGPHSAHHHTKTHCSKGHDLSDAYTVTRSDGTEHRMCSGCLREKAARNWANMTPEQRRARNDYTNERRRQRKLGNGTGKRGRPHLVRAN